MLLVGSIALMCCVASSCTDAATPTFDAGREAFEESRFEDALATWVALAESGDSRAQHAVGVMYYHGIGVSRNVVKAIKFYEQSADAGFAAGMRALALVYLHGEGVAKNVELALSWLDAAAVRGDVQAQRSLGELYLRGEVTERDCKNAVKWIDAAARSGDAEAEAAAAWMAYTGSCVTRDYAVARRRAEAAAKAGNHDAQTLLVDLFAVGRDNPPDPREAYFWALVAYPNVELNPQLTASLSEDEVRGVRMEARNWTPTVSTVPPLDWEPVVPGMKGVQGN